MAPTSADDLLSQAQAAIYQAMPSHPLGRQAGRARYDAMVMAWPALAAAQDRVLSGLQHQHPDEHALVQMRSTLARTVDAPNYANAAPPTNLATDRELMRAAALTGAAADALALSRDSGRSPQTGTVDAVLAAMETAARITAATAESGRMSATRWVQLASAAHAIATTPAAERRSELGSNLIHRQAEPGLGPALERWHHAAMRTLEPARIPSSQVPLIPRVLATVHYAAHGDRSRAGAAWQHAAATWAGVQIPGADIGGLRVATAVLRAELVQALEPDRPLAQRLPSLGVLSAYLRRDGERVATALHTRILTVLRSEQAVAPARQVAVEMDKPLPAHIADRARRGKWTPLPHTSHRATRIATATTNARDVGTAVLDSRVDHHGDAHDAWTVEERLARLRASAGFTRPTNAGVDAATPTSAARAPSAHHHQAPTTDRGVGLGM